MWRVVTGTELTCSLLVCHLRQTQAQAGRIHGRGGFGFGELSVLVRIEHREHSLERPGSRILKLGLTQKPTDAGMGRPAATGADATAGG